MFPNACNISLHLLSVVSKPDRLGNKRLVINKIKEVVGIAKSITSKEYQTSVMINKNFELKVSIISFLYESLLLGCRSKMRQHIIERQIHNLSYYFFNNLLKR